MADLDLNYDELLATFADEAKEGIAALESGPLALETTPLDDELRRDLLRYAHTLKGNASCVGLTALTAFAHAYEEILERIDGIDALRRHLAGGLTPTGSAANGQLSTAHRRSIRVAADRLDRMLDLIGEISIARTRIDTENGLDALHNELQELIMRPRMVALGPLFRQYARTVRDV